MSSATLSQPKTLGPLIAALALGACASMPPPTAQMAVAKAAVDNALGTGAGQAAPAEMQSARANLDRADAALATKDYKRARQYAERAEVDARLAQANERESKARQIVAEVQESTRALREEIDRQAR